MNKKIIIFAIIFLVGLSANAQEYLSGFSYSLKPQKNAEKRMLESSLRLPFFDDFTETQTYPDAAKWQNNNVLVNSGFPLYPTNYNAATLDILDMTGKVYSHASSSPFIADSLISNPISLTDENGDKLSPADSLYFSFYFQPQGRGDAPEPADSLVLMFGYELDTFKIEYDTVFVYEMLEYMQVDTIYAGDILYHDMYSTCNPDMFAISQGLYTIEDSLTKIALPCDTVFYTEMIWDHIWSTEGMSLDSFLLANDSSFFKQVMIPVTKNKYFETKLMFNLYY